MICMTAEQSAAGGAEDRKNGCADRLEKPVESRKLMEILIKYLPESKVFF